MGNFASYELFLLLLGLESTCTNMVGDFEPCYVTETVKENKSRAKDNINELLLNQSIYLEKKFNDTSET